MAIRKALGPLSLLVLICVLERSATAQSFRVQCPTSTLTHPVAGNNNAEPAYTGPTTYVAGPNGYLVPSTKVNGAVKCQQISGGDGYATMGDGTQTYTFSFGPLSGLADIALGLPGTTFPASSIPYIRARRRCSPAIPPPPFDSSRLYRSRLPITEPWGWFPTRRPAMPSPGMWIPAPIMDVGVMNGNFPAPLMAIDEDDEFFLTLSNVGQIMRPDLFEQHTVHFHGYPNASSFYDGVPDASVAINIGGSFTYYYLAPEAGTYFWHCHITPPEHLQMGMVGQFYVRPRQNRVPVGSSLYTALGQQQGDLRTKCDSASDILCSNPLPASNAVTRRPRNMPITMATARPTTTSSIPCRSMASTPISTLSP